MYREIIKHRGISNQLDKVREELLELNGALMNYKASNSPKNKEFVLEGTAECYNMLDQLCIIMNFKASDIFLIRERKTEREMSRIKEEEDFGLEI